MGNVMLSYTTLTGEYGERHAVIHYAISELGIKDVMQFSCMYIQSRSIDLNCVKQRFIAHSINSL